MLEKKLSRRSLLKGTAGMAGLALISACSPQIIEKEVEKIVKETVVVKEAAQGATKIRVGCMGWMRQESEFDRALADYNADHPDTLFVLEDISGGPEWHSKLIAQVAAGDPMWSGHFGDDGFYFTRDLNAGIVVPLEDYIDTSSDPAAAQIATDLLPGSRALTTFNGKLYGLSFRHDTLAFAFNKKLLEESGITELPRTWEAIEEACLKVIADQNDPGIVGFQLEPMFTAAMGIFYTMTDNPWRSDGILDMTSPECIEALELANKWHDKGIMPAPPWKDVVNVHFPAFEQGKGVGIYGAHNRAKFSQQIQGSLVISDPVAGPAMGGRAPSWGFPSQLYKGAPNLQETADMFINILGPGNEVMQNSCVVGMGLSNYRSTYEKIVPNYPDQAWQLEMLEWEQGAVPLPLNTLYALQQVQYKAFAEDYMLGKIPSAKEAMEMALAATLAEAAKQES